jgi:hypothetical protein
VALTNAELAPGLAQTVNETEAGLAQSAAMAANEQADAARFITENGQQAVDGHAPVGVPAGSQVWSAGRAPYSQPPA